MFIAILASSIAAGSVLGWYGHKVVTRIQTWGENMNEIDDIFQSVATPEELGINGISVRASTSVPSSVVALRVAHMK